MLPQVGVCLRSSNLNPIKKLKLVYKLPKNYRLIFLVKVVRNASGEKFRRKRNQYIPLIAVKQQTSVYSRPGLICLTIFLIRSLK